MILMITNKCRMNCSHCMNFSSNDGQHMKVDVIGKSLEFIKEIKPNMLIISGGEPTEHPLFLSI